MYNLKPKRGAKTPKRGGENLDIADASIRQSALPLCEYTQIAQIILYTINTCNTKMALAILDGRKNVFGAVGAKILSASRCAFCTTRGVGAASKLKIWSHRKSSPWGTLV